MPVQRLVQLLAPNKSSGNGSLINVTEYILEVSR